MAYYAPGMLIPSKLHLYHPESVPLIQAEPERRGVFLFLDLPGEIRNKIYDLVFEDCLIDISMGHQRHYRNHIVNQPPLGIEIRIYRQEEEEKKPHHGNHKSVKKQPHQQELQANLKADAKLAKQTSTLLQTPPKAGQKSSKHRQQRRYGDEEALQHLCHKVVSSSVANEGAKPADYQVPFNFLFSSRHIYQEALCILYAKVVFRFINTKAINRFLSVTPIRALQAIQGIEIVHATEPEPELTKNRRFKTCADRNWLKTCKKMREKMKDLKKLRLDLKLNDWPSQLGLEEEWAQSILTLRGNGLDQIDATLSHFAFSEDRLNEASRKLETAMISNEGQLAKAMQEKKLLEAKREKRRKMNEVKARKVLVIKMDNIPTNVKNGQRS